MQDQCITPHLFPFFAHNGNFYVSDVTCFRILDSVKKSWFWTILPCDTVSSLLGPVLTKLSQNKTFKPKKKFREKRLEKQPFIVYTDNNDHIFFY